MKKADKILFIINRHSGTGYQADVEGKILSHCEKINTDVRIEFTRDRGHATALAKSAAEEKFDQVFAVGGDGTINEVARALVHTRTALGVIPRGSGNGLARHLCIPLDIEKALHLINSESISIDTFTLNEKISVNVSGIGFDGYVASLFGKDGKRGLLSYGKLVAQEYLNFEEFECRITVDNKSWSETSFIVALANSTQYGNNACIAPQASMQDAMVDACFVKKIPLFQSPLFAYKLFRRGLEESRWINYLRCRDLVIETENEVPYHIDGEAAGAATKFKLQTHPASLLIKAPRL
ncbi:MAG: diacylglycerol kinase family lipid kinase [Cyclobacteriaceae bacterium]